MEQTTNYIGYLGPRKINGYMVSLLFDDSDGNVTFMAHPMEKQSYDQIKRDMQPDSYLMEGIQFDFSCYIIRYKIDVINDDGYIELQINAILVDMKKVYTKYTNDLLQPIYNTTFSSSKLINKNLDVSDGTSADISIHRLKSDSPKYICSIVFKQMYSASKNPGVLWRVDHVKLLQFLRGYFNDNIIPSLKMVNTLKNANVSYLIHLLSGNYNNPTNENELQGTSLEYKVLIDFSYFKGVLIEDLFPRENQRIKTQQLQLQSYSEVTYHEVYSIYSQYLHFINENIYHGNKQSFLNLQINTLIPTDGRQYLRNLSASVDTYDQIDVTPKKSIFGRIRLPEMAHNIVYRILVDKNISYKLYLTYLNGEKIRYELEVYPFDQYYQQSTYTWEDISDHDAYMEKFPNCDRLDLISIMNQIDKKYSNLLFELDSIISDKGCIVETSEHYCKFIYYSKIK